MQIFNQFEKAGVIYVMEEARIKGYTVGDKSWCNFGQGSAEPGKIKGAPKRINKLKIQNKQNAYAPVSGLNILRQQISGVYNDLFREGKAKYDLFNVDVSGGGRMAISRVVASLKKINLAYFVPDYASYEGILSVFNNVKPYPFFLDAKDGFLFDLKKFKQFAQKNKIKALLLSNPSNPTGRVIMERELEGLVQFARQNDILIIFDEFYFNYIYSDKAKFISASKYIKDIDNDPIVIISGLSKAWRYSGWRVCWTVGPKFVIDKLNRVGSFLDGGTSNPLQNAALKIVKTKNIIKETSAIQKVFNYKKDLLSKALIDLGFEVKPPKGSFYVWAKVSKLPKQINNGDNFFKEALKEKFIIVPGRFFDLNPYKKRKIINLNDYVRFSFGPNISQIKVGIESVRRMVNKFK